MEINKTLNGTTLTVELVGKLDSLTSPQFGEFLKENLNESITELVLEFQNLEYLSSAGIRQLVAAQNKMNKQGKMVILHANKMIVNIFDLTGMLEFFTLA